MYFLKLKKAASLLFLTSFATLAGAAYIDPLDQPAMPITRPSATSPMTSVAQAWTNMAVVGRRGVILVSANGGQSWTQASVPVSVDLTAIHFPSVREGWAVGHGGVILHSKDGGSTWSKKIDGRGVAALLRDYYEKHAKAGDVDAQRVLNDVQRLADEGAIHPFLDVWFENEKIGYVVGAFNLILRTEDGGQTWQPWMERTDNPQALHLYSVRGAGGEVFITGEQGLVMRLDRKAKRFRALPSPSKGSLFGVIVQENLVLAYGLSGDVFRSVDGGSTWQTVVLPVRTVLTGGTELSNGNVVLVSQGGHVLLSINHGESFSVQRVERPMAFSAVAPAGSSGVVLTGMQGVSVHMLN